MTGGIIYWYVGWVGKITHLHLMNESSTIIREYSFNGKSEDVVHLKTD